MLSSQSLMMKPGFWEKTLQKLIQNELWAHPHDLVRTTSRSPCMGRMPADSSSRPFPTVTSHKWWPVAGERQIADPAHIQNSLVKLMSTNG
ncbi:hypothetical protein U0070_007246 [Myodes glareolus]|uniref:Uncharacterized protein n=1 Tax=Myodes glareolus TaxID=447135 RepID=A0AAW0H6M5_MYOGA